MILLLYFFHQLFVILEKSGIQRGWGFWIPNQVGNDISIFGFGLSGLGFKAYFWQYNT